jgi:hypothetical protein
MRTHMLGKELLEKAIEAFRNTTGIKLEIKAMEQRINNNIIADAVIGLKYNGMNEEYIVEVKRGITTQTLGGVLNQINCFDGKVLIATDYVNPNMAEQLKKLDIPFIDILGNAYINEPPIYIFIKGNRPFDNVDKRIARRALNTPGRAFQRAGLKILFVLLCKPKMIGAPYREIAEAADVALGTVGWVFTDLRLGGFLAQLEKRQRRLINKNDLIRKWVEAYPEKLRPKLIIGKFKADVNDWWKYININKYNAVWGGEIAAARMTNYLKPEKTTIYIKGDPKDLIIENRLKNDPNGDIEILNVFWNIEMNDDLVHPLLVYADLLATGDARNIETAGMIYEEKLNRYIQ